MTALQECRTAVNTLREIVAEASPGPWWIHTDSTRDVWQGDRAAVIRVDAGDCCHKPETGCTGLCDQILDGTGSIAHGEFQKPGDARFVALMNPLVAAAIAEVLEVTAVAMYVALAIDPAADLSAYGPELALVRLINGGVS